MKVIRRALLAIPVVSGGLTPFRPCVKLRLWLDVSGETGTILTLRMHSHYRPHSHSHLTTQAVQVVQFLLADG